MYEAKIGPHTRVPTSEWSGLGFSKTHLSLFPTKNNETKTGSQDGDNEAMGGEDEGLNSWTRKGNTNEVTTKDGGHKTLGHQKSNLFDFARPQSSQNSSAPPKDLTSLFIENGLEKYLGKSKN
jgi:hypothetical protein